MSQKYAQLLAQFEQDVETAIEDAYRQESYVDEDGEPSESAMKAAAFERSMDHFVVKSKPERSKKALTNGELYSLVFPNGPGAQEAAPTLDPVAERVLKKLSSTVWGLTQTSRSGFLQKQLEIEESTLVVCRCRVYRNADPSQAVYATDNESLIMEDAVDKEIQSLVRRASSLRRDLSMIIERHPKLQNQVADQLGIELGRIDRELSLGAVTTESQRQLASSDQK
ncbi:MAG: hypothetical protein JWO14_1331 [Solirubrobacterales bacterium]|nr:hypothetical protein [Solirubrobacterales bacterium]